MENFIKIVRISNYHMRMLTSTIRIPALIIMVACFLFQNLIPVVQFSEAVNIGTTPYAFAHLTNDYICQLIMIAGGVVLFCNAPFEDDEYIYMLPRAGRFSWAFGQIICILELAFIYVLILFVISIIPFIGHLDFNMEWGKIWGTLAKTDAGSQYGLNFQISEYIVSNYKPIVAVAVSFLLEWACVYWIGLLIYFLNKLTARSIGTFVGAFWVLLDICISNDWMGWANRFSPVSLAQIKTYTGYNLKFQVNFLYGVSFFVIGILVLILLCIVTNYKERIISFFKRVMAKK